MCIWCEVQKKHDFVSNQANRRKNHIQTRGQTQGKNNVDQEQGNSSTAISNPCQNERIDMEVEDEISCSSLSSIGTTSTVTYKTNSSLQKRIDTAFSEIRSFKGIYSSCTIDLYLVYPL
jgi:hypothetical protein